MMSHLNKMAQLLCNISKCLIRLHREIASRGRILFTLPPQASAARRPDRPHRQPPERTLPRRRRRWRRLLLRAEHVPHHLHVLVPAGLHVLVEADDPTLCINDG
uniref:Uncharacterized protein n=1 Tax=Oryza brachyantha TaxID=4533 RepID=J3MGG7_ORYBR